MSTTRYSDEFKSEAIKMVLDGKISQNKVADELGIAGTTLSGWVRKYKANPSRGIKNALHPNQSQALVVAEGACYQTKAQNYDTNC